MSIEEYFNRNWENVKLSEEKKEQIDTILFFIKKYLIQKDLNYFEFGCGNCYITNFVYTNLKNNYGNINFHVSDISKVGLSYCDHQFTKTVVTEEKMSFFNLYNSMDVVTSFEVFEHLNTDLQSFYLKELLNISKEYILIGVPYQERLEKRNIVCKSCGYDGHIYGHLRSYDIDKFSSLFSGSAKLLDYKLCGATEIDFPLRNYKIAKKLKYKILNFTCPNCVHVQKHTSYFNRIKNKILGTFLLNKIFYKTQTHPFWIVGIFKKVNLNEKK